MKCPTYVLCYKRPIYICLPMFSFNNQSSLQSLNLSIAFSKILLSSMQSILHIRDLEESLMDVIWTVLDVWTQSYIQTIPGTFSGATLPLRSIYEGLVSPYLHPCWSQCKLTNFYGCYNLYKIHSDSFTMSAAMTHCTLEFSCYFRML